MKLSKTLRSAGLALGITAAATGCDRETKDAYGDVSEQQEQPTSTQAKPAETTPPAPKKPKSAEQEAKPEKVATSVNATIKAVDTSGSLFIIQNPKAKEAFEDYCKTYEKGRIKPFVREGTTVYSLCSGAADRIYKVLNRCEDSAQDPNLEKAFCFEDKANQTHFGFQHATLLSQDGTNPLVLTTSEAKNVQNTPESNNFWAHFTWAEETKGNIEGLPFSRNAEVMLAYPADGVDLDKHIESEKPTTPGGKGGNKPNKPGKRASLNGNQSLKPLQMEVSELKRGLTGLEDRVDGLEGQVEKNTHSLENLKISVKPSLHDFAAEDKRYTTEK